MVILRPRMWRYCLLLWCCLLVLPALAVEDLVVQRAVLMDPQGSFSLEDVQGKEFRPVPGPIGRGYTASAVWLRLDVAPSPLPQLRVVVQPTHLDDVRLYTRRADQPGWSLQQQGDLFPYAQRGANEVLFAFTIEPSPTHTTQHYLRVASTSVLQVHARVFSPMDSLAFDGNLHVVMGLYAGLVLAMLLFALVCWRITRDTLWGLDALFQIATLVFVFFIMGFTAQYLAPEAPRVASMGVGVMALTHFFVATLFFWRFVAAFQAPWWGRLLYLIPIATYPLLLVMLALGHERAALSINANLLLLESFGGMVVVWFLKTSDRRLLWLVRGLFLGLAAYIVYLLLPLLGLARMNETHLYPALLANLFSGVLLQVILARRTQLQILERWQMQADMRQLGQELKGEVERHAATSSFLGMMMHEIKTPLATIRLAAQAMARGGNEGDADRVKRLNYIQKSVDGIDAVLERCVEVDRLEQGALKVHRQEHDIATLVSDWASMEPGYKRLILQQPATLLARVDAPLTCLMLRNLVHNALSYSPPDSKIGVTLSAAPRPDGDRAVPGFSITVRNDVGRAGRPDPAQLFGKYYRADPAKHLTGTGLGLYWVRRVAELLDGTVHYHQDNEQVVFELWLPG